MTVVISTSFVLASAGSDPNNPLIGYINRLTASNIAATDSATGYPVTNLGNISTAEEWRANSTGTKYLTCSLSGAHPVDYVGLAKHNFGSGSVVVSVEGDLGDGYGEIVEGVLLPDDRPVILRFAKDDYTGIRLKMIAATTAPACAIMYVGELLALQRNIYVGHSPITLNRSRNVITGMSENANILGRITTGRTASTSISLQNLTPAWYRSKMDPFINAAETTPFFFAWRPQGYPREVGFAWVTSDVTPKNQRSNGMMQVDLSMRGIIG